MSDKTEAEEFDDEDVDELLDNEADVDLDRVNKDLDLAKRRARNAGDPAWRRLERLREDKRFAEMVSDFEDYDLNDTAKPRSEKIEAR